MVGRVAGSVLTFHFVLLGWVFFSRGKCWRCPEGACYIRSLPDIILFDNTTPLFLLSVLGVGSCGHFLPKSWFDGSGEAAVQRGRRQ